MKKIIISIIAVLAVSSAAAFYYFYNNSPEKLFSLGVKYSEGNGVIQDYDKGVEYLKLAAEKK